MALCLCEDAQWEGLLHVHGYTFYACVAQITIVTKDGMTFQSEWGIT